MAISPEYLAGVWDSDGSISVARKHSKRPNPSYIVSLQLTWSDTPKVREFLSKLTEQYDGQFYESKSMKNRYPGSRAVVKYSVSCRKSRKLLEAMLPFLQLKKEQAELALQVLNTMEYGKYGFGRPKPEALKEKHYGIYLQMKELNTKNSGERSSYDN